jgi:hypothetical protein
MDGFTLGTIAGSVSSLAFSYFPGLASWFAGLTGDKKSLFNLVVLVTVAIGIYVSNCYGIYQIGLTCDQAGILDLVKIFFAALVGSQATYVATKRL